MSARPNPSGYVVLIVPDFDTMMDIIERDRGQKLTSEEIEAKRKEAPAIVLPPEEAAMMVARHAAFLERHAERNAEWTAEELRVKKPPRGH